MCALSDDYFLINDIIRPSQWGRVNIDHTLLWKEGILVIETKNNIGEVKFFWDNWAFGFSPVYQAKGNVRYIQNLIEDSGILLLGSPIIEGLVVFPNAKLSFKGKPSIHVMNIAEVPSYLSGIKGGNEYSEDSILKIAKMIMESSRKSDYDEGGFLGILWQDFRDFFS
ncbi:MAG: nuclease-related domain-containing protein [Candidatus Bathyarchaeia archaeon]|jgi:hypothetical protein